MKKKTKNVPKSKGSAVKWRDKEVLKNVKKKERKRSKKINQNALILLLLILIATTTTATKCGDGSEDASGTADGDMQGETDSRNEGNISESK